MELPKLMTRAEVAEALRMDKDTVVRNARQGNLPEPIRVGGRLMWREADIAGLLGA